MEIAVFVLFVVGLLLCVAMHISVVWALTGGYLLFFSYGLIKKHSPTDLLKASLKGIKSVRTVLLLFLMIGLLTALWRSSGTIAAIISYAAGFIGPSVMLLMCFWLNCLVSVLTGTAFGTAATMGVISMSIARVVGVPIALAGGAILSGLFFGDRCSPVSTSALLVAELTKTDIYANIKRMIATSWLPFLLASALYYFVGRGLALNAQAGGTADVSSLFDDYFHVSWSLLMPAAAIIALSLFRINVKVTMLVSIVIALLISLVIQGQSAAELGRFLVWGYKSADAKVAVLMNGGGLLSMVNVALVVGISSSYSGLFELTGLLSGIQSKISVLSIHTSSFTTVLVTSIFTSVIACNQSLSILLTHQLCDGMGMDESDFAIHLENTAVVVAPLVPWSIAGGVPMAAIGAPINSSILAAWYLYLLPLSVLALDMIKGRSRC